MTIRRLLPLASIACVLTLTGADDATQTISAGGVTFEVPKDWKSVKPSLSMRAAQLKVGPEKGDEDAAELTLTALGGGGGSLEANIARWKSQFVDDDGKAPEIKTEERKGKNVDVTYAETAGRYVAAVSPGKPEKFDKPGWRMMVAVVQTPKTGYFIKMVGPEKTMKAAKPAFEAMIKTIAVAKE
jgi:hypothetical protein